MLPGIMGVAAFQINVLLTQGIAFWRGPEIIASFNYAVRLMELPQGIFGISLATFLLPTLSGLAAEKKYPEFRATLGQGLGYLVFINLLASVLLLTLAEPMMRLLFERGAVHRRFQRATAGRRPGVAGAWTGGLFHREHPRAGVLRPGRSTNPDAHQRVLPGAQRDALRRVDLAFQASRAGRRQHDHFHDQCGPAGSIRCGASWAGWISSIFAGTCRACWGAMLAAGAAAWGVRAAWAGQMGYEGLFARMGGVFLPILGATLVYFAITLWLKVPFMRDLLAMLPRRFRGK